MGARNAMTVAARYPDRIDAAVLIDAAPVDERLNFAFFPIAKELVSTIRL